MTRTARRLIVTGRVQGVFFRDWTVIEARALELDGWVRNLPDGGVEIVAAGTGASLDRLAARAREGPPRAAVTAVVAEPLEDAADGMPAGGFVRR